MTCPCRSVVQRTNKIRVDEANVKMPHRQGVYEANRQQKTTQMRK